MPFPDWQKPCFTETKTENFAWADSLLEDYTVDTKMNDNDFLIVVYNICILIKKK